MIDLMGFAFIPFFFLLAVVYGGLQISKLFENKAANMIIAIAVALFGATNATVVSFVEAVLAPASILFIIFFFIGFIWKFIGERKEKDYTLGVVVMGLMLLLSIPIAGGAIQGGFISENLVIILAVVFIIAIFYAAYKQEVIKK